MTNASLLLHTAPRVLVVDDDRAVRDAFRLTLEEEGYEVVLAEHGAAALSRIGEGQPAIILLDIRMPVMDGPTFARTYHEIPGSSVGRAKFGHRD